MATKLEIRKRNALRRKEVGTLTEAEAILVSLDWYEAEKQRATRFIFTEKGKIKNLSANYVSILEGDPYLKGKLSFDLLSDRVMIEGVFWDSVRHPLRDSDLSALRCFISAVYEVDSKETLYAAIMKVAHENAFNPVLEELESLPAWDGVPRIRKLFPRYLGAVESDLTEDIARLLLRAAVVRIRHPGVKFDTAVVIVDKQQGTGKSTIARFLALKDEYFCDDVTSFSPQDRPFERIEGKWICELGEMNAIKSSKSIENMRSFISRQTDRYRTPYATFAEDRPRRCIFVGTSNSLESLPADQAGNRRFLPLLCDGTRADRHPLADEAETRAYIRQCYAEILATMDDNDFNLTLPHKWDEDIKSLQELGTPDDPRVGLIQQWLDDVAPNIVCTRMILEKCFPDEKNEANKGKLCREVAAIMHNRIDGWVKYRGDSGTSKAGTHDFPLYGKQRAWERLVTETSSAEFVSTVVPEQFELDIDPLS